MIMLKESTSSIGPKNAAKNTPVLLMKQYPEVELFMSILFTSKFLSIANGMTTGINGATQQMSDSTRVYRVVGWKNTNTSFWNMNRASAPIHITAAKVK